MDWSQHGEGELDGCIARLRDDQRAQVHLSEDAALVEMRANAAAEAAHVVIETCRQRLREDAEEIERLRAEQV